MNMAIDFLKELNKNIFSKTTSILKEWELLQHELTSLRRESQELDLVSSRDPLTNLYNRRFVKHSFDTDSDSIRRHRPNNRIGIIFFDADHFKKVNDTYGHDAGDEVLRRIADITIKNAREGDIPFRWSGEEFGVKLELNEGTKEEQIQTLKSVAERIRRELDDKTIRINDNQKIRVTASFGVQVIEPADGLTMDDAMLMADKKLYHAKESGRNCIASETEEGEVAIDEVYLDDEETVSIKNLSASSLKVKGPAKLKNKKIIQQFVEAKEEVTQLESVIVEKRMLASTDELTQIPNRRGGKEEFDVLQSNILRNRPNSYIGSLLIDIDHFKKVNDVHGHTVGDNVLKDLSKILVKVARDTDIPCRFGGEEFVFFFEIPSADKKSYKNQQKDALKRTRSFAERLRKEIQFSTFDEETKLRLTASIGGYAFKPSDGKHSFDMACKGADLAMYKAKTIRNRVAVNNGEGIKVYSLPKSSDPFTGNKQVESKHNTKLGVHRPRQGVRYRNNLRASRNG